MKENQSVFRGLKQGDDLQLNPGTKWPNWTVDRVLCNGSYLCLRNTATGREQMDTTENLERKFKRAVLGRGEFGG